MDLSRRPPYSTIDFRSLTKTDANFKRIWEKASGKLDFHDAETVMALSKAILQAHFGLQLDIPGDRLCPAIPNRWNYVAWMQSLLDSTSQSYSKNYDADREVTGLDIGTGASAIYTMLCLQSRPNWTMCATDIDKKSFESAARNLALNNLMTRSKILQTNDSGPLVPLAALSVDHLDFTICNPPFHATLSEMNASLNGENKSRKPNAICTGAEVEMVHPDGDLGFVTRLINESLTLRDRVQWYSSMLGKLDSAKSVVNLLKRHGIDNWAVGVIDAGTSTKRWIVAWSFGDLRPRNSIARLDTIANEYLPFPTSYTIQLPVTIDPQAARDIIDRQISCLDLEWVWNPATSTGTGKARQNVWKRAYRREYERQKRLGVESMRTDKHMKIELAFRIQILDLAYQVDVEWLQGTDQVLWESFCGLVHRHFKKS